MDLFISTLKSSKKIKRQKTKYTNIVSEESKLVVTLGKSNIQNYIEEQLFEEIVKVRDMSDVYYMKAYQALTGDLSVPRAFPTCLID